MGLPPIVDTTWLSRAVPGMTAEFEAGEWASDDLLEAAISLKDDFFWQSHTFSHLARDDLGESDCQAEDGGKAALS